MLTVSSNLFLNILLGPSFWLLISWIFDPVNSRKSVIIIHFLPFIISIICFYPNPIFFPQSNQVDFHVFILVYNVIYYIFGINLLYRVYLNASTIIVKNKFLVTVFFGMLFSFFILLDLIHLPFISIHEPTKVVIGLSQKIGLLLIWCTIVFKEFERKLITINFNFRTSKELIQPVMQKDILPKPKSDLADIRLISFWENESSIYLRNDFNLNHFCKHLKMERKIVVGLLYDTYQQNFNEILNRYRIYHFVQKSKADKNKFQKFETIIQDCGYSNRSTFYLAFKKISKQTPSEFVKNMYSNE